MSVDRRPSFGSRRSPAPESRRQSILVNKRRPSIALGGQGPLLEPTTVPLVGRQLDSQEEKPKEQLPVGAYPKGRVEESEPSEASFPNSSLARERRLSISSRKFSNKSDLPNQLRRQLARRKSSEISRFSTDRRRSSDRRHLADRVHDDQRRTSIYTNNRPRASAIYGRHPRRGSPHLKRTSSTTNELPQRSQSLTSIGEARDVDMLSESTSESSVRSVIDTQRYLFESNFEHFLIFACFLFGYHNLWVYASFDDDSADVPSVLHHIVASICVAMPMLYMEMFIGQYTQRGVLMFGRIIPLAYGFGWAVLIITIYYAVAINLQLGDSLFYFILSFAGLPWMNCNRDYDTEYTCFGLEQTELCRHKEAASLPNCTDPNAKYSSILFYEQYVVEETPDWSKPMGGVRLGRMVCCLIGWVLVTLTTLLGFSQYKRILQMGGVIILAFFIVLYVMVLVQGGAIRQSIIQMFAIPEGSMTSLRAWKSAVYYALVSLGLCQGGHFMLGSFMRSKTSGDLLSIVFSFTFVFTSIMGGLFSYTVVYMLKSGDMDVTGHIDQRQILYTMLPQGLGSMAVPQLLTILYFCILFMSLYLNQVVRLDVIVESIIDAVPKTAVYRKTMVSLFGLSGFILGIPYTTGFGFLLQMDMRNGRIDYVFIALFLVEALCVFWLYGTQKFSDDIHFLMGAQPTLFWKICWRTCPVILFLALLNTDNEHSHKHTIYLTSVRVVSIFYCVLCASPLLIGAVYKCLKYLQYHNLMGVLKPEPEWGHPDAHERLMRHIYNPRHETRSRRRDTSCKHRCLKGSTVLQELIYTEKMAAMNMDYMVVEADDSHQVNVGPSNFLHEMSTTIVPKIVPSVEDETEVK